MFFLLLLIIPLSKTESQKVSVTDSLSVILSKEKDDTNKALTLGDLAWEYSTTDLKKARGYCTAAIELSKKLNYPKGLAYSYNTLGFVASDEGNSNEALKNFFIALANKKIMNDRKGIATLYSNIGFGYKVFGDYDSAMKYYGMALAQRLALQDKQGVADCYNNIGTVYLRQGLTDSARAYYAKAMPIDSIIGNKTGVAYLYNNLAGIYDLKGDYLESSVYYCYSAKLLEQLSDSNALIRTYNNISIENVQLRNYKDALYYAKKAMEMAEKVGNVNYSIDIYTNLGDIYQNMNDYTRALVNYNKGLELVIAAKNKPEQTSLYLSIGQCYQHNGDVNNAEINYKKALGLATGEKQVKEIVKCSNSLADFYRKRGKNAEAQKLFDNAIVVAQKNGLRLELRETYGIYAAFCHDNLKDLEKSVKYYRLYGELDDSLFSEDLARKFAEQQTRFETEKKEAQINSLKQQDEIKELRLKESNLSIGRRNILLVACMLCIGLLVFAGRLYFSKQHIKAQQLKEQAIRETEEKERLRIAKDIHDDLGSGLSKIKFLAELISNKEAKSKDTVSSLKSINETSSGLIENMRDLIWVMNPENLTLDSLIARVREYGSDYLNDFPIEITTDIIETVPDMGVNPNAYRNVLSIVKECLQNSIKHSRASEIKMQIKLKDDNLYIALSDNGKGFNVSGVNKGNGLNNMEHRAQSIGGTIKVVSEKDKGTSITTAIPLRNIHKKSLLLL